MKKLLLLTLGLLGCQTQGYHQEMAETVAKYAPNSTLVWDEREYTSSANYVSRKLFFTRSERNFFDVYEYAMKWEMDLNKNYTSHPDYSFIKQVEKEYYQNPFDFKDKTERKMLMEYSVVHENAHLDHDREVSYLPELNQIKKGRFFVALTRDEYYADLKAFIFLKEKYGQKGEAFIDKLMQVRFVSSLDDDQDFKDNYNFLPLKDYKTFLPTLTYQNLDRTVDMLTFRLLKRIKNKIDLKEQAKIIAKESKAVREDCQGACLKFWLYPSQLPRMDENYEQTVYHLLKKYFDKL